jgi:hypothetical protein
MMLPYMLIEVRRYPFIRSTLFIPSQGWMRLKRRGRGTPKPRGLRLDLQTTAEPQEVHALLYEFQPRDWPHVDLEALDSSAGRSAAASVGSGAAPRFEWP